MNAIHDDKTIARFNTKVRETALCWVWTSTMDDEGYGTFSIGGQNRPAHQVSWEIHHGEKFPEGMVTDHLCRNHSCVNPFHLDPVSNLENILRGTSPAAMNSRKTRCVNFHEFDEENTYYQGGRRQCRECARQRGLKWKARMRADIRLSNAKGREAA